MSTDHTSVGRTECMIGDYRAVRLCNEYVSMSVLPELGAKIVSLRNMRSGREWCWHPGEELALFGNRYGDSFDEGPHVGIDECFPTIEDCEIRGRSLPCHGEVWTEAWNLSCVDSDSESIVTTIRPRQSPFSLTRRISLDGPQFRFDYTLEHQGTTEESFIWALHPMLRIDPNDRIALPNHVSTLTVEASAGFPTDESHLSWPTPFSGFDLDCFNLGENKAARLKAFTPPLDDGWALIANANTGDQLEMRWDTQWNPYLGLWMTRGGYRGIQYVAALEPTNAPCDSLAQAEVSKFISISPGEKRHWSLQIILR